MTFKEFEIQYALGSLDEDILIDLSIDTKSKKILAILSNDRKWWIRDNIVGNISTPTNVLEKLSKDKNAWIRLNIARNTNTPISTLKKLFKDKFMDIRNSVVKNLNWKDRK